MRISFRVLRDLAPILLMAAAAPVLILAVAGLGSNTEDVRQWLPNNLPERQTYDRFVSRFGVDDVVLVSWPGCTLDDERLERLAEVLSEPAAHGLPAGLIQRVWTGPDLMSQLTSRPLDLSYREAQKRLVGIFVGSDGQTTCLVIDVSAEGRRRRKAVIETVRSAAETCGVKPASLRLGGNVAMGVAVDEETMRSFRALALPCALVAVTLAGLCLRNARLITIVLVASGYAELLALAMVRYGGGQLNSILIAMPSLIFVLTVSGTIHLFTYYRAAVATGGIKGSAGRALRAGWAPCTLAAGTTAVGMASLSVSGIETIRTFGLYSAAGLLGSLVIQLGFVPAILDLWPPHAAKAAAGRSAAGRKGLADVLAPLARSLVAHPYVWLFGWTALTLLTGAGLFEIRTSLRLDKFFRPDSRLMQDYRWLEANLGPLEQTELVLHFRDPEPRELLGRMEFVSILQRELPEIPGVRAVFSAASFVPSLPQGRSVRAVAARRVAAARVEGWRTRFVEQGLMALEGNDELWRVTLRVSALKGVTYPQLTERVRERVARVAEEHPVPGRAGMEATCTGMWPLFYRGQRELLDDLGRSFLAATLMITPMLMLAFRSLAGGILAMVPNLVPIAVVYGSVSWLGIPVDIGTVVTASVAIGMAVDGTLHFVFRYQRARRGSASSNEAVLSAFSHCATALTQTTVICGFSLLVFSASMFLPTARFAWLLLFTLLIALAADLALLPAILASRLGRWF